MLKEGKGTHSENEDQKVADESREHEREERDRRRGTRTTEQRVRPVSQVQLCSRVRRTHSIAVRSVILHIIVLLI